MTGATLVPATGLEGVVRDSILLGALAAALIAGRFETAVLAIAVGTSAAGAARAPWPSGRWFATLAGAGAVALLLNLYLSSGSALPLPRVLGRPATAEGLFHGGLLALRLAGAAVALHGLRAAWPGERAADELAWRLRPLERAGVPVRAARAMAGLALRFAPLVVEEHRRIVRIQDQRAGRPPRGWRERIERRRATAIPTVVAALETAERVALALDARHYRLRSVPGAPHGAGVGTAAAAVLVGVAALWRA